MFELKQWADVCHQVKLLDPHLFAIIEKLDPDKKYPLILADYQFGDAIVSQGKLVLPADKSHRDISKISGLLSYSPIPLFLLLQNSCEVFINTGTRVIPLNLFQAPSFLGLFETIDAMYQRNTQSQWCVSTGARSIFLLPKIYSSAHFRKLRAQFQLPLDILLNDLSDHWQIFKNLANHKAFSQPWQTKILLFTDAWFKHFENGNNEWNAFYQHLMKNAWSQAQFAIEKVNLRLYWEHFVNVISTRNFKPIPYIADQIRHILLITTGLWPGFKTGGDMQTIAPIKGLQDAFLESYQLKDYLPTFMYPSQFDGSSPVYYSLSYPTLLEGSPVRKSKSTIMLDIKEIKMLLDIMKTSNSKKNDMNFNLLDGINLEYFHVEDDKFGEIASSLIIPNTDKSLLADQQHYPDRSFCHTSSFWRGCVRITKQNS